MDTEASCSRSRRRVLAVLAAVTTASFLTLLMWPHEETTDASFTDGEFAASGTLTALTVPAPVSSQTPGCVLDPGLLGANPVLTISWRVPAGVTGYSSSNAQYGSTNQGLLTPITGPLLSNVTTTGTTTAYTTVMNGGLLSGLLGNSMSFGIRFVGPGGWTSSWLVATASAGALGANPKCTMSTAPSP